jgi:hypothetical protein
MKNDLPQIYWYVFWLVVFLGYCAFKFYVATIRHRRNMKALDILSTYAEKGAEPPAAITDQLAKQILDSDQDITAASDASPQQRRGALVQLFIGFTFASSISWALNQWLMSIESANWAIFASRAAFFFFGLGAAGLLLVALFTRDK